MSQIKHDLLRVFKAFPRQNKSYQPARSWYYGTEHGALLVTLGILFLGLLLIGLHLGD